MLKSIVSPMAGTCAMLALAGAAPSGAETRPNWLLRQFAVAGMDFHLENDTYGTAGTDQHFTNGWQALFPLSHSGPVSWLPMEYLADSVSHGSGWVAGQNMYSPKDITIVEPQHEDRPYAGYLFLGRYHNFYFHFKMAPETRSAVGNQGLDMDFSLVGENAGGDPAPSADEGEGTGPVDDFDLRALQGAIDSLPSRHPSARLHLRLALGVTGKYSYAEETQKFVHEYVATSAPEPMGWDHQVPAEPVAQLAARLEWQYYRKPFRFWTNAQEAGLRWLDFGQEIGADVGTVYDQFSTALLFRFGLMESPFVTGTENILTKAPRGGKAGAALADWIAGWRFYAFAQPRALLVLRNAAIHCGFRPCRVVQEHRPGVLDLQIGLRATLPLFFGLRLNGGYTLDWRSTEVKDDDWEPLEHSFGGWQLGFVKGVR